MDLVVPVILADAIKFCEAGISMRYRDWPVEQHIRYFPQIQAAGEPFPETMQREGVTYVLYKPRGAEAFSDKWETG